MKILLNEKTKAASLEKKILLKEGAKVTPPNKQIEKVTVWCVLQTDTNLEFKGSYPTESSGRDITKTFKSKYDAGFDLAPGFSDWGGNSWLQQKIADAVTNSHYPDGSVLAGRVLVVYKQNSDNKFIATVFGENVKDHYMSSPNSYDNPSDAANNVTKQEPLSGPIHLGPTVVAKDHGGSGAMNDIRDALVDGLMEIPGMTVTTAHTIADYAVEHPVISVLLLYLGVPAVISLITSVGGGLVSGAGGLVGGLGNIFKGGGGSAAGGAGAAGGGFDVGSLFKLILAGGLGYFLYQYLSGNKPSMGSLLDTVGLGDTFEYGKGRNDEKFKQLQRCLIRFAGGNLVSERSGLDKDAAKYMLTVNQTAPGYAAFFGAAGNAANPPPVVGIDDGTFGPKTATAISALKDTINKVNNNTPSITDIHSVPVSLLGSKACTAFIDPKPLAWEQKVFDEVKAGTRTAPLTPQELGAAVAPRIAAPQPPAGVNSNIVAAVTSLTNATITLVPAQTISKEMGVSPLTINVDIFIKDKTYNGIISSDNIKIDTEKGSQSLTKQQFLEQIAGQDICSQFKCDQSKVTNITKNKTATFSEIIADASKIQESKNLNKKVIKDSRIHKDYDFLSQKNARLHNALMEGLLKDIKRG